MLLELGCSPHSRIKSNGKRAIEYASTPEIAQLLKKNMEIEKANTKQSITEINSNIVICDQENCANCKGKGTLNCSKCHGAAVISKQKSRQVPRYVDRYSGGPRTIYEIQYYYEDENCDECNSNGEIMCGACGGEGKF